VIAAQHQREGACIKRLVGGGPHAVADLGDVVDVLLALVAEAARLAQRCRHVAAIHDRASEHSDLFRQAGDAER
jgi:hypothetical protein